jgi:RNA polymerase sigma-70 factor (sigma-E family)
MPSTRDADFDEFFRAVYPAVYRAALRIVGDGGDAEDAAIEALTRAFVRWPRLRSLPHRDAWVMRVVINEALSQLRRRKRSAAADRQDDGQVLGTDDALATRLTLVAAVSLLPRRQREAIGLRYLADMSEADTADVLGLSTGTVKSHLHRATHALRVSLGDDVIKELLHGQG